MPYIDTNKNVTIFITDIWVFKSAAGNIGKGKLFLSFLLKIERITFVVIVCIGGYKQQLQVSILARLYQYCLCIMGQINQDRCCISMIHLHIYFSAKGFIFSLFHAPCLEKFITNYRNYKRCTTITFFIDCNTFENLK